MELLYFFGSGQMQTVGVSFPVVSGYGVVPSSSNSSRSRFSPALHAIWMKTFLYHPDSPSKQSCTAFQSWEGSNRWRSEAVFHCIECLLLVIIVYEFFIPFHIARFLHRVIQQHRDLREILDTAAVYARSSKETSHLRHGPWEQIFEHGSRWIVLDT